MGNLKIKKSTVLIIIATIAILLLMAYFIRKENESSDFMDSDLHFVWNVYWDHSTSEEELTDLGDRVANISHFAAYFDANNHIFIPKRLTEFYDEVEEVQDRDYGHYLTFVNDKVNQDGSSSLKDQGLLYDLLESEEKRQAHIEEIIEITQEGGYDGLEIDYEGIKKDETLWAYFVDFAQELTRAASDEKLGLRIILEPSTPFEAFESVTDTEYVIMLYNLHGKGTKPGPKADKDFMLEMIEKTKALPTEPTFAIATGGFDWQGDKVTAVTEAQAREISFNNDSPASRDTTSQYLVFNYVDENNQLHEVWFADALSIEYLLDVGRAHGINSFALWRLGGNIIEQPQNDL